jgi:hypothetical protein
MPVFASVLVPVTEPAVARKGSALHCDDVARSRVAVKKLGDRGLRTPRSA